MEILDGTTKSPLRVEADLRINGIVTNTVAVASGATLLLHGMITNLVVEAGGRATVHGTVTGKAINLGHLEVHGTVANLTPAVPPAFTKISQGAMVNGRLVQ